MAACFCLLCGGVTAQIFNTNLIVNGDAEAGPGSPNGGLVATVPGWTTNGGSFAVVQYGASGGFPFSTDPGPATRGTNFFSGGPTAGLSAATQVIDVSAGATSIDAGSVRGALSGYLGGFSSQGDNAMLTASFRDATNATLGAVSIGPVTAADRQSFTGLLYREASSAVPAGTRSILVTLQMNRTDGTYNDGYADNLALVLLNSNANPRLNISTTTNTVNVSWPTTAADWILESSTNLISGWTTNAASPVIVSNQVIVVVPSHTNARQFFRLRAP
ncbi:MAG TPA: hypothetical protein VL527_06580 [Dongiaceae bacterium]|nr:hypothetical protein [Dongiaceae bacterium]